MTEPEQRPHLFVFAAALISSGALALTARGLPLIGVFAAAILVSPFVRYRLVDRTMLRWFLRIMLIAVVITFTRDDPGSAFDGFGPTHTRDLFGEICVAEMVVQFWRRRTYDPHRSTLAILLMSGLTFLTASNTFEENFIRYIAPLYLMCIAFMANGYRPRGQKLAGRRAAFAPALLRGFAVAAVLSLGAAGYRVILVNRSALSDLGNRVILKNEWNSEGTAMSAQPTLGPIFGLRGSAARVLRIANYSGDEHLVGVSYDTYINGAWGPGVAERHWQGVSIGVISASSNKQRRGNLSEMYITRLVNDNPLIYLPLAASSIDFGDEKSISRAEEEGGPIRVRARAPYDYAVEVAENELYQGIFADPITPEERKACLTTPTDDPESNDPDMDRVEALAHKIAGHLVDQRARVNAVESYLLTHHAYSLTYHPSGKVHEPLADFLLSTPPKAAHCEFFASGAALLLRYVAIPTRYVTGYFAHEIDSNGDRIVRQRDAHAWCEAWIDNVGWVTVEATPVSGRPESLTDETPVEPWRKAWEWLQDKVQALTALLANITPEQVGGVTMALTVGAAGLIALRSYYRRRGAFVPGLRIRPYSPPIDPSIEAISVRFESLWGQRLGVSLPANRSFSEFVRAYIRREALANPDFVARALAFSELYEAARFGGKNDGEARGELEEILKEMEASPH